MSSSFEQMFAAAGAPAVAAMHGKTLSFVAKGQAPRNVNATAVQVLPTQELSNGAGSYLQDAILVSIDKDPTTGIAVIALGDGLTYGGKTYSFDGSISDELADRWSIRFVFNRPFELGGNRATK